MTNPPLASISKITLRAASTALTLVVLFLFGVITTQSAQARTFAVLYDFTGTDGAIPEAGLVRDTAGNLYGTTEVGGAGNYGTVFELTPTAGGAWTEKVLHTFNLNGKDGAYPATSLIFDAAGNLYGTTVGGGKYYDGTVFELTPKAGGSWTEKVYSFSGKDGESPWGAGLIVDAAGNLYGTTFYGGSGTCNNDGFGGCGTVFELTTKAGGGWAEKVLYSFRDNGKDGNYPYASLIFDAAGNLYGTTVAGGKYYDGTVFELTPKAGGAWTEKLLHTFKGSDGYSPYASLIFDASGNLYGTTSGDGSGTCNSDGCGTVFELIPKAGGGYTENVLHSFNGSDGSSPYASLIFDASGNLYGTTLSGGGFTSRCTYGCGTVFELTPKAGGGWTEKVLLSFNDKNGAFPVASLMFDASGSLYGTTSGGSGTCNVGFIGCGKVFKLTP